VIAFPATGRPVRVAKAVTIAAASKLVAEAFTTGIPCARDEPYFLSVKKRVGCEVLAGEVLAGEVLADEVLAGEVLGGIVVSVIAIHKHYHKWFLSSAIARR
jgi:hypothetical protein